MPTPPMAIPARAGNPTWRIDARCRGADADRFFAPSHVERKQERQQREAVARELCRGCPVRVACLDYALTVQEPHGIWGGLTENERRRLLREQSAGGGALRGVPDLTDDGAVELTDDRADLSHGKIIDLTEGDPQYDRTVDRPQVRAFAV